MREHLDFSQNQMQLFSRRFELISSVALFENEIKRIRNGIDEHDLNVYGLRNPLDFDYFWRTAGRGDLVAFGFHKMINGEDQIKVGFKKDVAVTKKMKELQDAIAPTFFINEIPTEDDESLEEWEQRNWLDGIWLLIRGGNLAHYLISLERQKNHFLQHGKLLFPSEANLNEQEIDAPTSSSEYDTEGPIKVPDLPKLQHKFVLWNDLGIVDLLKTRCKTDRQLVQLLSLVGGLSSKQSLTIKGCVSTYRNPKAPKSPYSEAAVAAVRKALNEIGIDIPPDKSRKK